MTSVVEALFQRFKLARHSTFCPILCFISHYQNFRYLMLFFSQERQKYLLFSCHTQLSTSVFFKTRQSPLHRSFRQNDISNPCDPNPLWGRQGGDRPPSQSDRNHCCSRILSTAVGKTYVGDLSCIFGVCTDPYEPKILLLLNILNI